MARSLTTYSIYVKKSAASPLETMVLVPETFSFLAFFLGILWAGYHRIWLLCGIFGAALFLLYGLASREMISPEVQGALQMALNLWVGLEAPYWRGRALARQGYSLYDVVHGRNPEEAAQRFFDHLSAPLRSPIPQVKPA